MVNEHVTYISSGNQSNLHDLFLGDSMPLRFVWESNGFRNPPLLNQVVIKHGKTTVNFQIHLEREIPPLVVAP